SGPVFELTGIAGTSAEVPGLASATAYHWRVRAVNAAGNGLWSETWQFTTADEGFGDILDDVLDSLLNIVENPLAILPLKNTNARLGANEEVKSGGGHSADQMTHEVEAKPLYDRKT